MFYLIVIILGTVQGATEFLPVSSSGHLALSRMIMKRGEIVQNLLENPLMLDILLHVATLAAVLIFFRARVREALFGAWALLSAVPRRAVKQRLETDDGANMALCVLVGTLPTGVIGVLLSRPATQVSESPVLLGAAFLACAGLLFASRFRTGGERRLSPGLALVIGVAQGIAVLPGISRSGTTIAVALALGLRREEAAVFSFLLSVPAILGAAIVELDLDTLARGGPWAAYLLGAAAAFAVGLAALYGLVALVKKGRLWLFSPYLAAVGIYCLVVG